MRYIITGGTGLIGRALAQQLVADGHQVIALSRTPGTRERVLKGVEVVGWDARTAQGWGHLVEGAEAIVNLAGANLAGEGFFPSRWTRERKRIIRESRISSGRAVLAAVEQARDKPRVVLQASGVGYYGFRGDEPVTEEADAGDDYLARLAADEWEPSTEPVEEMGVRRVILRSGAVLTPEEGALPRLVLPFRFFVGGTLGRGDQWHSWIHLRDEVRAMRFLMEQDQASGPFNLTAPQPATNKEFGRTLGRVLNRPAWVPVPEFALRLAVGQVSEVLLEGQRAVPRRLLELGFSFRFPDLEGALRDLLT